MTAPPSPQEPQSSPSSRRRPGWSLPRPADWRAAFVSLALGATMLVSAASAWGVHQSNVRHAGAVRAALDEYAKFAARTYGERMIADGGRIRVRLTAPAFGVRPADVGRALSLAEFAQHGAEVLDDEGLTGDEWRGFFRVDLRTGEYEGAGAAARADLAAEIREAVGTFDPARASDGSPAPEARSRPALLYLDLNGEPVSLGFDQQVTAGGEPVAIFGYTLSRRRWMHALSEAIVRSSSLTPPSLIDPDWRYGTPTGAESMVALQVLDHQGRELYRSAPAVSADVWGEFSFRTGPGGFVTRAGLAPAFVERMTATHHDATRRRLLIALPLLSALLALAAVVYLARERAISHARRDFVASVSHELRTPLAQIRMFSETLLLQREKSEEERLRWLGVIGREARRLGDLVESILLFSHVEAARVRLEPERTDLGELAESVVEGYLPLADAREMRLLADAPSRIFVHADPRALRQVIVNLLDNALKYGPVGQQVRVEVERHDGEARLLVSDEGPGIPAHERTRVWRPFVRLGHGGGSVQGSGIGLAVVRGLVAHHGGRVWVEQAEGGGARMVVSLPLLETAPPPMPPPGVGNTAEFQVMQRTEEAKL